MSIEKRIERIEAILDARGLDWDHPRVASDHFAEASKMVAEEPAKDALPAWQPKVGDWVRVTRPQDWEVCKFPYWPPKLDRYNRQE